MKHETLNSILGGMGLVIAIFTAWSQFKPEPDNVSVVNEGQIGSSQSIEVNAFGPPLFVEDDSLEKVNPIIGPVLWKVRVFNKTNRTVSVIGAEVFLLGTENRRMTYSRMGGVKSDFRTPDVPVSFPDNLPAQEGKAYIVALNIPINERDLGQAPCLQNIGSVREIERCYFKSGRDLFGNPVEANFNPENPSEFFHASWPDGQAKQPRYLLQLKTGDGSSFFVELPYFPPLAHFAS